MATYQQSITALVDGLKTLFENRTCTEAQALANATSKPNTIYYTTDTHCVVVGGQIYGRGQQLSSVFRFCPSGSVPGQDPDFSDPDYIYVVPDGTSFTLYWLNPGGAWSHTTGFQFDIATSAEDISYDLTQTPDLGEGDVQSAIESLDTRIDNEKVEFIKERFPYDTLPNIYGAVSTQNKCAFSLANGVYTVASHNNKYITFNWKNVKIPKGTLIRWRFTYSLVEGWANIFCYSETNPQEYYTTHNNSMVGFTGLKSIFRVDLATAGLSTDRYFIMPVDGYPCYWLYTKDMTLSEITCYDTSLHLEAKYNIYDDTDTQLGVNNVQSAIEAEDAKVEQLSLDTLGQKTDGSVEEYWEDMQYEKYHTGYGGQNQNAYISGTNPTNLVYNTSNAVQFFKVEEGEVYHIKGTKAPNTHYKVAFYNSWSPKTGSNGGTISSTFISGIKSTDSSTIQDFKVTVPEGALMMAIGTVQSNTYKYYQTDNTVELYRKVNRQPMSIADKTGYKIEDWTLMSISNTGVIGSKLSFFVTAAGTLGKRLEVKAGQVLLLDLVHGSNYPLTFTDHERVITELHDSPVKGAYVVPNDGYAYLLNSISHETDNYIYNEGHGGLALYGNPILQDYYNKGLADGSGMASIVGLGYNIYDYISGDCNLDGFEYGVEFFKAHPTLSGRTDTDTTLISLQNNTSMVYFPKCTMTGVTHVDKLFYEETNLVCVPPLHFGGITNTGSNMFSSCTKLEVVPPITGFVVGTSYLYMFKNTTLLSRIESLDVSGMTETGRSTGKNNNIFRSTTGTNNGLAVKRYILFKGIGTQSANTHWYFHSVTNWGVANADNPDARQSLIDTLLTYSFDRATAGFANCTVHLAANTFNQLTTEEKEQITAKGYVLTTS